MFSFRMIGYWVLVGGLLAPPCAGQALQWEARFDDVAARQDRVYAAARSADGDVHVLGTSNEEPRMITFGPTGEIVREARLAQPPGGIASTLVCGPDGALFMTGSGRTPDDRFETVRLFRLPAGGLDWLVSDYEVTDFADVTVHALRIDQAGNVVILAGGYSGDYIWDIVLVSFTSSGELRWAARRETVPIPDFERTGNPRMYFDMDAAGNSYVTATTRGLNGSSDYDALMIRFDSEGIAVWERTYSVDPSAANEQVYMRAAVVGADGVHFISLTSSSSGPSRIMIQKYSFAGQMIWTSFADSGAGDIPAARVDPASGDLWILCERPDPQNPFRNLPAVLRVQADGTVVFLVDVASSPDNINVAVGLEVSSSGGALVSNLFRSGGTYIHQLLHVLPDGTIARDERVPEGGSPDPATEPAPIMLSGPDGQVTVVRSLFDPAADYDMAVIRYDGSAQWVATARYNGTTFSNDFLIEGSASSYEGGSYLLGRSTQGPQVGDLVLVRYSEAGQEQWRSRILDVGTQDGILRLDRLGLPIVVANIGLRGTTDQSSILAISFNADGTRRWRSVYDGPTDQDSEAFDAVVSPNGSVLVTGRTRIVDEYLQVLIRFRQTGGVQWDRLGLMGVDGVTVDSNANSYVLGPGFSIARFRSSGATDWFRWIAPDACQGYPTRIAADSEGNALVGGLSCDATNPAGPVVTKWSSAADIQWTHSLSDLCHGEPVAHLTIGWGDETYVLVRKSNSAIMLARLSRLGAREWATEYEQPGTTFLPIELLTDGNSLFVAGKLPAGTDGGERLAALRYSLDGQLTWRALYDGHDHGGFDAEAFSANRFSLLASAVTTGPNGNRDFSTIRFGPDFGACDTGLACLLPDTNTDCRVDLDDLAAVLVNFGASPRVGISPADGDVDFDGSIILADLAAMLAAFGSQCP